MKKARGSLKVFVFAVLVMGMIAGFSLTANAAGRWHSSGSRIWYTTSGSRRAYGLRKIGSFYYYFNGSGYLQTGWVTFQNGTIRYFPEDREPWRKREDVCRRNPERLVGEKAGLIRL